MITAQSRPSLARGVRLVFDHVRGQYALLYPEGVRLLNDTAAAILLRCDGATSIAAITETLAADYDGVRQPDVSRLINDLEQSFCVEAADACGR